MVAPDGRERLTNTADGVVLGISITDALTAGDKTRVRDVDPPEAGGSQIL